MFKRIICGLICFGLFFGNTPVFAQATSGKMTLRQAIMHYAQAGDVQSLQRIRARGFDIDTPDENANSALCEAVWRGDSDAAATLIKVGANQNSSCMKRIPKEYKQSAGADAEKQKMMQLDLDTVSQNGSPAVVGVASKEATLTTGAMIGIGVGAAALIGGGIVLASDKDNNKSKETKSTDVCPPGYTGEGCQECVAGYGKHGEEGDNSCYKTLTCYHGGKQVGDVCTCKAGYYVGDNCQTCEVGWGWHGTTECWADIACENGVQVADTCQCEVGYDHNDETGACTECAEGYGKHGEAGDDKCYLTIDCDTQHGTQIRNTCVCEDNWTGTTCSTCGLTGVAGSVDTEQCECISTDTVKFVQEGLQCIPNPSCSGSTEEIENCATQTTCIYGTQTLYTCEVCNENFDPATNCTQCLDGYILSDGSCVEPPPVCPNAVKDQSEIPGCAQFVACPEDETFFNCTNCDPGYKLNEDDGRCYTDTDRISLKVASTANTELSYSTAGNANFYGLYYENAISGGAYTKTKGTDAVASITMTRTGADSETEVGKMAGIYTTKGNALGSYVNAKEASATNTIAITNNSDGDTYGICSAATTWGARLEKATKDGEKGKSTDIIAISNTGNGNVYGLYGPTAVNGAQARVGTAINAIEIVNKGDGEVFGLSAPQGSVNGATTPREVKEGETVITPSAQGAYAGNSLTITNTGDGAVYGLNASKNIYGSLMSRTETKTDNLVTISDNGNGDVYGFKSLTGNIYGGYGETKATDTAILHAGALNMLTITNEGSGSIYGFQTSGKIMGAITNNLAPEGTNNKYAKASNSITITNTYTTDDDSERKIVGFSGLGTSEIYGANSHGGDAANAITIVNNVRSAGNAATIFGIEAPQASEVTGAIFNTSNISGSAVNAINIDNLDDGDVYGIYAKNITGAESKDKSYRAENTINIYNYGNGSVYGMKGNTVTTSVHASTDPTDEYANYATEMNTIKIRSIGSGNVYGIYAPLTEGSSGSVTIQNTDSIDILSVEANQSTRIVGVYADKNVSVTNKGNITITHGDYEESKTHTVYNASDETGVAVGIYVVGGNSSQKTINNAGNITINGFGENGYGIYVVDGKNVTIKNTGSITIDAMSYTGDMALGHYIVLNGGSLIQSGTLSVSSLNATEANLTLGSGSQTIVTNNFYGTATVGADTVMNGFKDTYTETEMISAGNVDDLNLVSGSHLFNATLADNGTDVLMTRKSFEEVTDNSSLAAFLEANYTLGNNEAFFNDIKSIGNGAAFKSAMSNLTGQETISKFAHEDLTAMREVNLQMNEKMFANNDKPMYQTQGNVSGFSFKNDNHSSANYALGTKRIAPRWKVGYAMSRTNVNTDDDHDTTRHSEVFQAFAPIGYEHSGVKLISTPQVGFARGHYTRKGYNGTSYSGIIEKRIFALMNEARYPTQVAGFEIAPTVEFNAIAYNQRGSEDNKEYALTMPSDNQLSVEAGMGLYANKQIGNVKFNAGLMMYREFADPYNIKMGMNGMEGTFNLYDDNREYRGVASFGFNYDLNAWNVYGKVQHFIENDTHTNMKAGIKYTF